MVVDAGTVGTLEENEYFIFQGALTVVGGVRVFTVGTGLNTGNDSLVIYDADGATAGVQQAAIVLVGVTAAEEANIINTAGVLTVFGA